MLSFLFHMGFTMSFFFFLCLVLENLLELSLTLPIWFNILTSLQISSSFDKFQLSVGKI